MIPIPDSVVVKRSKTAETLLADKARAWIEQEERAPGIHASDLLDERMAFFQHTDPRALPARLVNTFLVGKVLHAFVLQTIERKDVDHPHPDIHRTDAGSEHSDRLGVLFSPDSLHEGVIRELKTSRSFYEPKDHEDLRIYIEQLLVYMAAKGHTRSQLWILYLNFRDEDRKTSPAFRAYDISLSEADLEQITVYLRERAAALKQAIETNNPDLLPLCREWKCGRANCEWYDKCQPKERYGDPRFDGQGDKMPEAPKVSRASQADQGVRPVLGDLRNKSKERSPGKARKRRFAANELYGGEAIL